MTISAPVSFLAGGELPGGEITGYRDNGSRQSRNIHIRYTSTSPLPENKKNENRKMWTLKDVKIVAAEISLINSVLACERRRISGCHWFRGGDNRQPEIRLRSQANSVPVRIKCL